MRPQARPKRNRNYRSSRGPNNDGGDESRERQRVQPARTMNIRRTLRMLRSRYLARITKGTRAEAKNRAPINTARAHLPGDDVPGVMDHKQLEALIAKLTDTASTIATTEALNEGRRIGAGLVEVKLRLHLVEMLHDQGVDIPNKADIVASLKTQQRELKEAEQATISEQLPTAAASGRAELVDEKSAHNRTRKLERETRKGNGDCVECPKKEVRRAAPLGDTTRHVEGERQRARANIPETSNEAVLRSHG